jgi:uncharacterized protein
VTIGTSGGDIVSIPTLCNPCTTCGACCTTFRVGFCCTELDTEGGRVPAQFTERLDKRRVRMGCTQSREGKGSRCIALVGTVGRDVSCEIYARRPSPCRAFAPEAPLGRGDVPCADARRHHGLPPLRGSYDAAIVA